MTERIITPPAPDSFIINSNQEAVIKKRMDSFFGELLIILGFDPDVEDKLVKHKFIPFL